MGERRRVAVERSPAFQFYPRDFLTDSHVIAMALPERGAYITLLCLAWMEGSLPVDHAALAKLCSVPIKAFERLWPALRPCFTVVEGRLVQPRIERERCKQAAYREAQAAAGKASAAKRWGNAPIDRLQPKRNGAITEGVTESKSSSSSSSSSSSPKEDIRWRPGGGPIIGRNPHLDHAACDPTLSYCVPSAVHRRLADSLAPRHGGDRDAAKAALQAWYPTVWATLPLDFTIGNEFKFWCARFDVAFATPDAATDPMRRSAFTTTTEEDSAAVLEILRKGRP
jgi:uncharacterized protein YdaU (DUF1376 family)